LGIYPGKFYVVAPFSFIVVEYYNWSKAVLKEFTSGRVKYVSLVTTFLKEAKI